MSRRKWRRRINEKMCHKKLKEGRISGDASTPQMRVDADLAKRRSLGNSVETTSANIRGMEWLILQITREKGKARQHIKKQRHCFADKGSSSQSFGFSSSHVQMWVLDHKEGWALKNWCFWIVLLEKNLESPLDCMEIKPVNPKGNQSWIFIGRTDADAPILHLM